MPSGAAHSRTWARWALVSRQVWWMVSSGAPDSSNWPPGSSEIAPRPVGSVRPMMLPLVLDPVPAEEALHQLEEAPDAALALVGHGAAVGLVEAELLVLGADAPRALRLGAGGERLDKLVARFDRRRVGNVAGHSWSFARGNGAGNLAAVRAARNRGAGRSRWPRWHRSARNSFSPSIRDADHHGGPGRSPASHGRRSTAANPVRRRAGRALARAEAYLQVILSSSSAEIR